MREVRLSDEELAGALGATTRTVNRWRTGESVPQHASRERIESLVALIERLSATFRSADAATLWLRTGSEYLDGLPPIEALRAGRLDAVGAALEALDSGIYL